MRAVGSGTRHSACSRAPVAGPLTRRSRIVPRWIAMPLYGRGLPSTSCLVVGGCSMKLHRFAARSRRAKFCRASRLVCLLPVAMANLRASGSREVATSAAPPGRSLLPEKGIFAGLRPTPAALIWHRRHSCDQQSTRQSRTLASKPPGGSVSKDEEIRADYALSFDRRSFLRVRRETELLGALSGARGWIALDSVGSLCFLHG